MKHSLLLAGVAFVLILGASGCGLKQNTKAAEAEVDRFHQRWNAEDFKAIYDEAHANFRNSQSADVTIGTLQGVKHNYGAFKSATRRSWGFSSDDGVTNVKLKYRLGLRERLRGRSIRLPDERRQGSPCQLRHHDA